jgi:hypothetical protein
LTAREALFHAASLQLPSSFVNIVAHVENVLESMGLSASASTVISRLPHGEQVLSHEHLFPSQL